MLGKAMGRMPATDEELHALGARLIPSGNRLLQNHGIITRFYLERGLDSRRIKAR